MDPAVYINEALGVPTALLSSAAATQRAAAAQLLRRTPFLCNVIEVLEDGTRPFSPHLWRELDVMLAVNVLVIECATEALRSGELDPLVGGYPVMGRRPWELLQALEGRVRQRLATGRPEPEADVTDTTSDDPNDPLFLADDKSVESWLRAIVLTLLTAIAENAGRQGWPLAPRS